MNPWTVIGWVVLGLAALSVLALCVFIWDTRIKPRIGVWLVHLKTRNVQPAPGQVWIQDDSYLTITSIADNGRICMTTKMWPQSSGASWSDSPEEWRKRVRKWRLWLLMERCEIWANHLGLEQRRDGK